MDSATSGTLGERADALPGDSTPEATSRLIDAGYVLPDPMPGETVRSFWERFHRMSSSNSIKETLEAMFGPGARLRAGHCLPSRLTVLSRRVGADHAFGSTRYAIEQHTTLPYHCYFHTTHQREHAYGSLLGERGPAAARATLGMAKSPVLLDKEWPAFCPECVTNDNRQFGFTYWKAVHQLPPVAVCPWHGCRLREVRGKHTNWCGYGYLPPPDLDLHPADSFPSVAVDAEIPRDALLRIAKACLHVQERPEGFPGDWRTKTLSALTLLGYKSKGGMDHPRIAEMVEKKHGAPLLTWLGLRSTEKPISPRALRSMLGFQRARQPTIFYIVLALAITDDLPSFERVIAIEDPMSEAEAIRTMPGSNIGKMLARASDVHELEVFAKIMNLDIVSIQRAMLRLCGRVGSRAEPIAADEHQQILDDAKSGASSFELRAKYRLHLSDLFLVLERDPSARRRMEQADFTSRRQRHRDAALDFLRSKGELTEDQLRKAAKSRFKLLQRYDIEWYRNHFPAPTDVGRRKETPEHMAEIDLKLSNQVARMIRILVDEEGISAPTQGDVLSRCRASDLFLKHRGRLPKTVAVLAPLAT